MKSLSAQHVADLVARAKRGNTTALGQLLQLYRSYLLLLARIHIDTRLQSKLSASDIVQETFMDAQQAFDQFRGTSELELMGWLRKILANRLASQVRRYATRQRDVNLEQQVAERLNRSSIVLARSLQDRGTSPSQRASQRERAVLLADALSQLPDHYREIVVMRHIEELTFPEIAKRLGRSLDSVKNVWTRAIVRLRQELE